MDAVRYLIHWHRSVPQQPKWEGSVNQSGNDGSVEDESDDVESKNGDDESDKDESEHSSLPLLLPLAVL